MIISTTNVSTDSSSAAYKTITTTAHTVYTASLYITRQIYNTYTHTHVPYARFVLLNLSIAHALAFYSIELVICMYERSLILFSISVL